MSHNNKIMLFTFLIVSSLFLSASILGDWLPWLRGPAPQTPEWYWPYLLRPISRWWPSILSAILYFLISIWWLNAGQTKRWRNVSAILGIIVASFFLQVSIIYADRPQVSAELIDRTLSNLASGFFETAAEIDDLEKVLKNYPQAMAAFSSEHAQTHPPGLISANWLTIRIFSRLPSISNWAAPLIWPLRCTDLWLLNRPPNTAAALGFWSILPLLAASLTIVPGYALARELLEGRAVHLAALLMASTPALLLFAPKSVQLYPIIVLTFTWAFIKGLNKLSFTWMFAAGVLLSILTFLSIGNASLILPAGIFALLFLFSPTINERSNDLTTFNWNKTILPLFLFGLGALSVWAVVWLFWRVSPAAIFQTGLQQHYQLVTNLRRYEWWVWWNLIDLFIFGGWPVLIGFVGSIILTLRLWFNKKLEPVNLLTVSLLSLILILNFSGSARGE